MDRSSGQKPNREIIELTDVMNQTDLIDYLQKISPQHKTIYLLITYLITKQVSMNTRALKYYPVSYQTIHRLKPDFNNRNNRKPTNSWKLSNSLWNGYWVKAEKNKGIKDFL